MSPLEDVVEQPYKKTRRVEKVKNETLRQQVSKRQEEKAEKVDLQSEVALIEEEDRDYEENTPITSANIHKYFKVERDLPF